MKYLTKIIVGTIFAAAFFTACDKADMVPTYKSGNTPTLFSSVSSVADSAADSSINVIKFSWTSPDYATDSSTVKYILQIDSSANFTTPNNFVVSGALWDTLTGVQLNTMLLNYGFKFNTPYKLSARLISSYANNNDLKTSNTITVTMQAYVIPPKVTPPSTGTLFIIGDATQENPQWTNSPLLAPTQQFEQIDSVTYGGIFFLSAGGSYLLLPVDNGDWTNKYGGADTSGTLLVNGAVPSSNTPAPSASGWYQIIVSFQTGTFTVTPYSNGNFTGDLWIIGDATPENPQWANDSTDLANAGQHFTQMNSVDFQLTIQLNSTGSYLFLPVAGDWSHKYGGASATGGPLLADGNVPGSNTPPPATAGNYLIDVNFLSDTYSVTPQ